MTPFTANDVIMSIAWLNELAKRTASEDPDDYIIPYTEAYNHSDFIHKVVYDRHPIEMDSSGIKYPIFIDSHSLYNEESTGIKGTFCVVVCNLSPENEEYFKPFVGVELEGYDENSIVIENGKWFAV